MIYDFSQRRRLKILMFVFFVISVLVQSGVNGAQAGVGGSTIKKNVCNHRKDSGPCGETDIRFFFNSKTEQCEEFTFGGCEGNANNFRTKQVCIKYCVCNLRADPGPCEGSFTRYYYKDQTEQCETFVYGGCNGNNFQSIADCQPTCA